MKATLQQYMAALPGLPEQQALQPVLKALCDRFSTQMLGSGGLAIKGAGGVLVKAATAFYAMANGVLVNKAANTDMAALVGTVTNAAFNVFCFYIDSAGTLTSQMGTEGASLALVKLPEPAQGKAMIGMVVINPTGTGNFVGGTTALDDATVVPTAAYVNTLSAFDPSVRLGI